MRRSRREPLVAATASSMLFTIFGTVLVGGSSLNWYAGLVKPWYLVRLGGFYLVGLVYYVHAAVLLHRILVHVDDPGGISFALIASRRSEAALTDQWDEDMASR